MYTQGTEDPASEVAMATETETDGDSETATQTVPSAERLKDTYGARR